MKPRFVLIGLAMALFNSLLACSIAVGEGMLVSDDGPYEFSTMPALPPSATVPLTDSDPSLDMTFPLRAGYDDGFVISGPRQQTIGGSEDPFRLRINGFGQLRDTVFNSGTDSSNDLNQIQLKRGRLTFSGNAFDSDIFYLVQLDGRSNAADQLRILDYYFTYDLAHAQWGCDPGTLGFRSGLYKIPFTYARGISSREFEFADRSMASIFFDVNRSLAWGLYGSTNSFSRPVDWEVAIFNGLVTGGAETGSSGNLDNNNAYSGRLQWDAMGEWGSNDMADLEGHEDLALRIGGAGVYTTIDRKGLTEFNAIRVVDSGSSLALLLPGGVDNYSVTSFVANASIKWRGWSSTLEYYWRNIDDFQGATVPTLSDDGFWLQAGKFVIPEKLQLMARWSRVRGTSGMLGVQNESAEEIAAGAAWHFRDQHVKLVVDATHVNGAPISSSALDIFPGDDGWLFRTQFQFGF
ncbi:Phosphate-selective porin O and P [Rubripirellula tenax]|uniref:Phosphate-selective porin O and P n=1 Tax=Rubripirellula tenax TaxID=2528015 RepID=A0A5C6FEN6_9BACT|nr:hypothetical protein [Rubripirellula tenax]TWU58576.1 Phosphate-selective porin O and P [Rubripirellula tenax]